MPLIRRELFRRRPRAEALGEPAVPAWGRGAGAGTIYIALSLGTAGVMTFVFIGLMFRSLSPREYGAVATLWSATLLFAPVMWTGVTQTLGRYVAESEAHGEDWSPVVRGTRRLGLLLLAVFVASALLLGPLLTRAFFDGHYALTAAFVAAVACHYLGFFRRGLLSGHRQFPRVGASYVAESLSRVCITAALLLLGFGAAGPAIGIALAPLLGALLVRVGPTQPPKKVGTPFDSGGAFRFMAPVLVSMACAQAMSNGGALLISGLGGPGAYAQAGLLVAALTLARAPQSVLGPAVGNLLPHLSRMAALGDARGMALLVLRAVTGVLVVGIGLVGGMWLLGEFAMKVVYGSDLAAGRGLLTVLALLAALLLLCELLNQVLYALGYAWTAAAGWLVGLAVTAALLLVVPRSDLLSEVSLALALGAASTTIAQVVFLARIGRHVASRGSSGKG